MTDKDNDKLQLLWEIKYLNREMENVTWDIRKTTGYLSYNETINVYSTQTDRLRQNPKCGT